MDIQKERSRFIKQNVFRDNKRARKLFSTIERSLFMSKLKFILGSVLVLAFVALAGLSSGTFTKAQAADQGTVSTPLINEIAARSGPWMRNGVTSTVVNVSANSRFGICARVKNDVVVIKDIYYQVSNTNVSWAYPAGTTGVAGAITAVGSHCYTFTPVPSYYMRFIMYGNKGSATGKVDLHLFRQ
jgi:hypothetical protein